MILSRLPQAKIITTAPGRVNLLGEHVDYNDGSVLPAAIDRAVTLAVCPTDDNRVTLYAIDLDQRVTFDLDQLDAKTDIDNNPLPTWALYPAGVAACLQRRHLPVTGLNGVYTSDVPIGAGLSSSAAVEVAFAVTWQYLDKWEMGRVSLAQLCQEAENSYVGMSCGIMDQFASANGVKDHALYFDTRSLEWEPVPLPPKTAIIIADSGVRRSLLTGSEYNQRRADCEEAVRILKGYLPGIRALRDVSPGDFARFAQHLNPSVRKHAQHAVEECARVDQAVICLRNGDAVAFGKLMYATHASLRDLFEVSCPELDLLVEIAAAFDGCLGARLTGAGFGGCTVNLVDETKAAAFIDYLKLKYHDQSGHTAQVYLCHASDGAQVSLVSEDR